MTAAALPLGGLYQLGFVTPDLDRAMAALSVRYGVSRFRRRRSTPWMETAHAYAGETMLELICVGDGAPAFYTASPPAEGEVMRLHHLGRRIPDVEAWGRLEQAIAASGLDTPMKGEVMDGDLKYAFVDTRADLGLFSEYLLLQGSALGLYDDVPHT